MYRAGLESEIAEKLTLEGRLKNLHGCHSEESGNCRSVRRRTERRRISNLLKDKCARFFATLRMTDHQTFSTVPLGQYITFREHYTDEVILGSDMKW